MTMKAACQLELHTVELAYRRRMSRPEDRPEVEVNLPELTPPQTDGVLQVLRQIKARRQPARPACSRCGLPVVQDLNHRWIHQTGAGRLLLGCRAATRRLDGDWQAVPEHWQAHLDGSRA